MSAPKPTSDTGPAITATAAPSPAGSWRAAAIVAWAFCAVVLGAMLFGHLRSLSQDPLKPPHLVELKRQLQETPKDEQLKARIRTLDLEVRRRHFQHLAMNRAGAWLLGAGVLVGIGATRQFRQLRMRGPLPLPTGVAQPAPLGQETRARWSVAATASLAFGALLALAWTTRSVLPARPEQIAKLLGNDQLGGLSGLSDLPGPDEVRVNWPRFLGPSGVVQSTDELPLTWNLASGTGLVWKVAAPVPGFNSPIVWSNRVFLSAGNAAKREVFCFNATNGATLWQQPVANVPGSPAQQPDIPEQTGFAASSMATDGRRAYALFANGELAAFSFDGTPVWTKYLGAPKNAYGHACSLITWQGQLLVQMDQGDAGSGQSRLYSIDGTSGRITWERSRPVPSSWATPRVFENSGKPLIITLGVPWVIAYAASSGSEIWRADCLAGEVTPSPAEAGGLVLAISPSDKLLALRLDGQGDVSKTHIAWTSEENVPDITSPVSDGQLVYTVTTSGTMTCSDLKDGKKQWERDLAMECNATPGLAGSRLYVLGRKGGVTVVEAARTYKELAHFETGEPTFASPAFSRGRMFVRTERSLICIGGKVPATIQVSAKPNGN